MSFQSIGEFKAAKDIEQHELTSFNSTSKPFSFKIPTHIVEAIDICSNHMGMSRNQLVNKIIITYLAQAFSEFVDGYSSAFVDVNKTEAQRLLDELNKAVQGSNASDEAVGFLNQEIINFIDLHDMASSVSTNLHVGKLEAE